MREQSRPTSEFSDPGAAVFTER